MVRQPDPAGASHAEHEEARVPSAQSSEGREARARLERIAAHRGRLLDLTAVLAKALRFDEVADAIAAQIQTAAGASASAVWVLADGGATAALLRATGDEDLVTRGYRTISVDDGIAIGKALLGGEPLWFESRADYAARFPRGYARTGGMFEGRELSFAALPLITDGRVMGALSFAWCQSRAFDPDERELHVLIARYCAQAFDRARQVEHVQELREQQERAGAALREAVARAEEANRIKDEFLATVSHELRTPLAAITSWTTVLEVKGHDPATVARGVQIIRRNALAQARLIEDLLDVSRIIAGKLRIEQRSVDLVAIARDAMEVVRPSAEAKQIALTLTASQATCFLVGDAERLQQVVWNLVSNAVKFTDRGGHVAVAVEQRGPAASVTVTDDGRGIAPDLLPCVFERFQQGDSASTRRSGGLGLGLAIVRHIVELHGGHALAESAGERRGATFRVELPVRAIAPPPPSEEPASSHPPRAPSEAGDIRGVRVLVVDDEPDARDVLREVLASEGAAVETAASVREAFELFSQLRPDVLVSDIGMPIEDGYALVRRVRGLAAAEGGVTPAIALTAFARTEDRLRALRAGFDRHIAKPVDARELIAVIASLSPRGK